MNLLEYQGKAILAEAGIPVPRGVHVRSVAELDAKRKELPLPAVVKAQVLVGGRGKAGGIQFAATVEEAKAHAGRILGMDIKGHTVRSLLVEERLSVAKELYAAVLVDRSSRLPMFMVSADGGMDIESVPDARIHRATVNPLTGFSAHHARRLVGPLGLPKEEAKQVSDVLARMWKAFVRRDAELLEVNPLIVAADGRVLAADAKVIVNDGALFRQPDLEKVEEEYTPLEREARAQNIAFVELPGTIGVIANGAGLTMATLDALTEYGGGAGVFLDLGGTDNPEQVQRAVRMMKRAEPSVILLNLFGGITKCDTVARGLKDVIDAEGLACPVVARIKGTNEGPAREILKDAGFRTADTLEDAARIASELEKQALAARGKRGGPGAGSASAAAKAGASPAKPSAKAEGTAPAKPAARVGGGR